MFSTYITYETKLMCDNNRVYFFSITLQYITYNFYIIYIIYNQLYEINALDIFINKVSLPKKNEIK